MSSPPTQLSFFFLTSEAIHVTNEKIKAGKGGSEFGRALFRVSLGGSRLTKSRFLQSPFVTCRCAGCFATG